MQADPRRVQVLREGGEGFVHVGRADGSEQLNQRWLQEWVQFTHVDRKEARRDDRRS